MRARRGPDWSQPGNLILAKDREHWACSPSHFTPIPIEPEDPALDCCGMLLLRKLVPLADTASLID